MMAQFHVAVCLLLAVFNNLCGAFWFYGYDQVYRDPFPETSNNEIVATAVITYLASVRNLEVSGVDNPYTYTMIMFESVLQYETATPSHEWNLGVWDSFIYCDEKENTLCLLFSDGEYCDNGLFRETSVELTCHFAATQPTLYQINEYEECVYEAKLYLPELCATSGTLTQFLRSPDEIDKIKATSYISSKGNRISVLPYQSISGVHQIGLSMSINEVDDYARITLYGPVDKYFAVGFGSNGMFNTYAIVINGHDADGEPQFFEQVLDSHAAGYTLPTSFNLESHKEHDGVHQITLTRKLSSAVEIDAYWIFSCVEDYVDIIWAIGKSTAFERHVAFGQDRMDFTRQDVEGYDKSSILMGSDTNFTLKINWSTLFILFCFGVVAWWIVKKYKQNIIAFGTNLSSNLNLSGGYDEDNDMSALRNGPTNEYGSAAQDVEPLIQNKL